ncbi:MAG: M28 family peptidase [Planctomycetes bacterium]|nr:M28 family peptidase [Planctomycetota bacterium]
MLNRSAFALFLAAGLSMTACGGPSGPIDGDRAMTHVEALVKIGPRPFGSDNLAKAADYIEAQLKDIGLSPQRHEVMHAKEKKMIRNLYCQIDGADPEQGPILMIGAHYDTKLTDGHEEWTHTEPFVGAIDGGGGPAVLIELARALKNREPKPTCNVLLYWIDAEESIDWTWNDDRALLGSKAFYEHLKERGMTSRLKAFVLLDLIGSKNMKFDEDGNSATDLLKIFGEAAEEMGASERMYEFPTDAEIAAARQQGINWGTTDDHLVFKNRGIPSVLLIDFSQRIPPERQGLRPGQQPRPADPRYEQWWHTIDDDLDAMDPDSLAFAGNLVMQAFPKLEAYVTKGKQGK